MKACPYLEYSFDILGKKWNGMIIHYLSNSDNGASHFSKIKEDLPNITAKALSIKLSELIGFELLEKSVVELTPLSIEYKLTKKGMALANALKPIQEWAVKYGDSNIII